jgi:hypothetical protein
VLEVGHDIIDVVLEPGPFVGMLRRERLKQVEHVEHTTKIGNAFHDGCLQPQSRAKECKDLEHRQQYERKR